MTRADLPCGQACSSSTSVPQKSFGMQKQHRLAVRADLRLAIAEHARALRLSVSRAARMSATS